jgi:hypothetical protein
LIIRTWKQHKRGKELNLKDQDITLLLAWAEARGATVDNLGKL